MKAYLRGNYTLDVKIEETSDSDSGETTEAFERTALARLGGSICFVSKKAFLWKGDGTNGAGEATRPRA